MDNETKIKIPITIDVELSEGWGGERWDVIDAVDERSGLSLGDIGVSDFDAFSDFPDTLTEAVLNILEEYEDFQPTNCTY